MSQFSLPLPSKITDDPGSKSTRIRRSSRGNDLDKDEGKKRNAEFDFQFGYLISWSLLFRNIGQVEGLVAVKQ